MSDPITVKYVRRMARSFGLRLISATGKVDLTGGVFVAGIEKEGRTHNGSTAWCRFRCTGHGTSGVLSCTIPSSIGFTGAGTMRVWRSGSPRTLVADAIKTYGDYASSNWITG